MFDARRRSGRLFYLLAGILVAATAMQGATGPSTTTISDVVYRADGTPAGGTLLISWNAFISADGKPVAAGSKSVNLGTGGALAVDLVPNAGANPAGTLYTVIFQLDDGTVKTEYWSVGTESPTTVAAVRATLGATNATTQMASRAYVDTAVAGKASDASVVHLNGSETIAGTKQFAAAPAVPAPVGSSDAVNKAYVDEALANVGAGSYVNKNGDTMLGPLTLNADPTSPGHASTRRYVDSSMAAKADMVSGVVPPGELGTGPADGSKCLRGDGTWGACGTSSNAVSIQSVPVDTTLPTDGQVITYETSSGKYKPKAGGGVTAGMQALKYAVDFGWTQSPATDLSTPGAKTVNLAACPAGVKGSEPEYYVYIAGTGTPEAVKVTGGTCAGAGAGGTLQFTTANSHSAGYTVGSASGGIQEALIAARFTPTNPNGTSQAGYVIVPPGEYKAYARISIRSANITVDFSGSIVECYMSDACLYAGDPANALTFQDITIINPRGRPMVASGTYPFVEVNAQKTRLLSVATRSSTTGSFGYLVQVDGDQAFLLDGIDSSLGDEVRCDAMFCGAAVYAPGTFAANPAVGWLKHANLTMNCKGNGVDWQSGNTLRISDSVIQGYSQFGIRTGVARGGYGPSEVDNVYMEVGNCTNPVTGLGIGGVIAQGQKLKWQSGEGPQGKIPQFANTGTTDYRYYLVPHHATYGYGNPLYAGKALTNGSGTITITTPDIAGADRFDILRVTPPAGAREQAPFGTGNFAVATSVTRTTACTSGVCTFTDTQGSLSSYTVATPTYFPGLTFWPGDFVLASSGDSNSVTGAATLTIDSLNQQVVGVAGTVEPSVFAGSCYALVNWTPAWISCVTSNAPPTTFYEQGAQLLAVKPNTDGGTKTNLKGRINFTTLGTAPGHIITLSDSNLAKTIATANNRPTSDANDAFIGYDQADGSAASVGVDLGAPKSISSYIGNVGDGTNWKERLTSTLKEFKTDVKVTGNLTVTGTCTGCGGGGSSTNADTVDNKHVAALTGNKCLQSSSDGTTIVESSGACGTGSVASFNGRTGAVMAAIGDYTAAQVGALGSTGPQTFSGDLTVTGKMKAGSFESTGAGAWSVEGNYGTMTAATAGKSKIGFDANGRVSVSENAGAVTELAKKTAQEFTYTFFDPNNPLTMSLQVPSIYVNRAAAFHVVEVFCEIDAGSATINLSSGGSNILSSDLACSTAGATSTSFGAGRDAIAVGAKINHVTVSTGAGLHRVNVVVKYTVD